jgi:hypothetical protein
VDNLYCPINAVKAPGAGYSILTVGESPKCKNQDDVKHNAKLL